MGSGPKQPSRHAVKPKATELRNSALSSDGRHHAEIAIAEPSNVSTLGARLEQAREEFPLLLGDRRNPGQGLGVCAKATGSITNHKDVRVLRHREVCADLDPPCPVRLRIQPSPRR